MVIVAVMVVIMPMMVVVVIVVVMIAIRAAGMVFMAVLEEVRIVFQRALQVEGTLVQHAGKIDAGAFGLVDAGGGVDGAHDVFDAGKLFLGDEVALVDDDDIGKGDLVFGFAAVLQAQRQVLGIDQCDDGIELGLGADIVIHEEGLGNGDRIGKAGGFDNDAIETARTAHQAFHDADEVTAHRAADAAIVHLVDFLVGFHDQVVVDADFAELVDDDRIFLAVVLGQDAIEQGGLAGTQIAGQHGDGNGLCSSSGVCFGHCFGHGKPRYAAECRDRQKCCRSYRLAKKAVQRNSVQEF